MRTSCYGPMCGLQSANINQSSLGLPTVDPPAGTTPAAIFHEGEPLTAKRTIYRCSCLELSPASSGSTCHPYFLPVVRQAAHTCTFTCCLSWESHEPAAGYRVLNPNQSYRAASIEVQQQPCLPAMAVVVDFHTFSVVIVVH